MDVVFLPESAVDESEVADLEALLDDHGVGFVNVGVRGHPAQPGRLARNWIHTGISPRLQKGGRDAGATREQWFHIRQHKLNRWSLDEGQVYQYNLGGVLHPHIRWWEGIEVPPRVVQVVELGEGMTLVFLVCEDLAQSDGLADVLRAVGPDRRVGRPARRPTARLPLGGAIRERAGRRSRLGGLDAHVVRDDAEIPPARP